MRPSLDRDAVLRVGVFGLGNIAMTHYVPRLLERGDVEVVGLWDTDEARVSAAAARRPTLPFEVVRPSEIQTVVHSSAADVVLNLTPPQSHFAINAAAIGASAHVYCEKPLAMSSGDVLELMRRARARQTNVVVAPFTSGSPLIRAIRRALDSGELGETHSVRIRYGASSQLTRRSVDSWRADPDQGGILVDLVTYPLAVVSEALGTPHRLVAAHHSAKPDGSLCLAESWSIMFTTKQGVTVAIDSSSHYSPRGFELDVDIFGTEGQFRVRAGNLMTTEYDVRSAEFPEWRTEALSLDDYHWSNGVHLLLDAVARRASLPLPLSAYTQSVFFEECRRHANGERKAIEYERW